jgi:hypothetical protein
MRLPIAFGCGGFALKGLLLLAGRFFQSPEIFGPLLTYDPLSVVVADAIAGAVCETRGIAPGPCYPVVWEVLLAVMFGIECFVLAALIQRWLRRRSRA